MIKKIDHVGIAVKDIEKSKQTFIKAYGAELLCQKENPKDNYVVAVFRVGQNLFSMLESTSPEGFVAKHIERYGEGVQHIAIEVENLDEVTKHWEQFGFKTVNYEEIPGIRRQVLLTPKNGFGIIFQVMEWLGENKTASDEERMRKVWS